MQWEKASTGLQLQSPLELFPTYSPPLLPSLHLKKGEKEDNPWEVQESSKGGCDRRHPLSLSLLLQGSTILLLLVFSTLEKIKRADIQSTSTPFQRAAFDSSANFWCFLRIFKGAASRE